MNKKIVSFLFITSLLLTACAGGNSTEEINETETEEVTEKITEVKNFAEDYVQEKQGTVIETEEGTRTVVKTLYDVNDVQESGPFRVTIHNVRLSKFQPLTKNVVKYGGYDLGVVAVHLLVENISNDPAMIYPAQGVIKTDTGKKVNAHFSLSDEVGGKFDPLTAKEGVVYCFFDGDAAEVSKVIYQIEAPHDEDVNLLGDNFEFSFFFEE